MLNQYCHETLLLETLVQVTTHSLWLQYAGLELLLRNVDMF